MGEDTRHPTPDTRSPGALSVVIPAYRAAATIATALRSVARQTRPPNEVIVVDDASSDATVEAVRGVVAAWPLRQCPLRTFVQDRNAGPAAARNRGVAEATGEWIAFLDGDDAWLPDKLERQMATLDETGGDMICGGTLSFATEEECETALQSHTPCAIRCRPLTLDDFVENNPVATSTVVLRKVLFDRVGGFDERFRGPEDFDLWLRVAAAGRVLLGDTPVSLYRYVPGSLSMDERTFLPEVLGVLDKAFATGGALAGRAELRRTAEATQYWNASWMAFNRGNRAAACRLWWLAWRANRAADRRVSRPWARLLLRYVAGPRLTAAEGHTRDRAASAR